MRKNKDNQTRNPKQERGVSKVNQQDLKDQQEILPETNSFEEKREKLQEELQGYYYSQSSKFSSVSRSLIFGILATIWVFIYTDGNLSITNRVLLYALIVGILYLAIDILHYFLDSISYHKEQYRLDEYKTTEDLDNRHEPFMDGVNKRSYAFFITKFIVLFLTAFLFITNIIQRLCQ
jgi:hypothetical protein